MTEAHECRTREEYLRLMRQEAHAAQLDEMRGLERAVRSLHMLALLDRFDQLASQE
jgi:hypothetical protein